MNVDCPEAFPSLRLLLSHPSLVPGFFPGEGSLSEVWIYLALPSSSSSSSRKEAAVHPLLSPEFLAQLHPRCAPGARIYYFFELQRQQQQQPNQQQQQEEQQLQQQQKTRRQLQKAIKTLRLSTGGQEVLAGPRDLLFDFFDLGAPLGPPLGAPVRGLSDLQLREDDGWLQGMAVPYTWVFEGEAGGTPTEGDSLSPSPSTAVKPAVLRLASGASVRILDAGESSASKANEDPKNLEAREGKPPQIQHETVSVYYAALIRQEPQRPNFRFKPKP